MKSQAILLLIVAGALAVTSATRDAINTEQAARQTRSARKLVFSPYVNLDSDLSANQVGQESAHFTEDAGGAIGPFAHAPVPTYGLGGMMPASLGLTNQPFNYMYGQPAVHPAISASGMALNSQVAFNPSLPVQRATNAFDDASELDDIKINDKYDSTRKLKLFDDPLNPLGPSDGNIFACNDVQQQAIEISNAIMRKQNKVIFKEIMEYMLRSKYIIAKTEIKMVRTLRKKIYGLMNQYSSITEDQVDIVAPNLDKKDSKDMDKEIDEEYGADEKDFSIDTSMDDF